MEKKIVLALFLSAFLAQGKASNVAGFPQPTTPAEGMASVAQPVDLTTAAETATQSVVYLISSEISLDVVNAVHNNAKRPSAVEQVLELFSQQTATLSPIITWWKMLTKSS